jgi:hypothetical protein
MGAFLRAHHVFLIRLPGHKTWAFVWGIGQAVRSGRIAGRTTFVEVAAKREVELDDLPVVEDKRYVLQGTVEQLSRHANDVIIAARIGRIGDADVVEAIGYPKEHATEHLVAAPRRDVVTRSAALRGATIKLPFDEFTFANRFAIAGALSRTFKCAALVRGFDIRVVLRTPWAKADVERFKAFEWNNKKPVKAVFTDSPMLGSSDVGNTPSDITIKQAAAATPCGLVVAATGPTNELMWKKIAEKLGVELLRFSLAQAAMKAPSRAVAEDLDDVAIARGRYRVLRSSSA